MDTEERQKHTEDIKQNKKSGTLCMRSSCICHHEYLNGCVFFQKWIGFLIVISHCITPRHCQLEQQRPINTVIRCEGQTTRAAIMSSLKTQILFLPLFSFQLLSSEYNFLRVP